MFMSTPFQGVNSHIKRWGSSLYLLGVKNAVLVPLRVFSLKRSTARAFTGISRKTFDRRCVVLELAPLTDEKRFKPRPQNRILVPLTGSFQNFQRAPPSFFMGVPTVFSVTFLTEQVINTQSLMH